MQEDQEPIETDASNAGPEHQPVGDLPIEPSGDSTPEPEAAPAVDDAKTRHDRWCAARIADGWAYGAELDEVAHTDPRLVHFDNLPDELKASYA
jgi:hypothetical protein